MRPTKDLATRNRVNRACNIFIDAFLLDLALLDVIFLSQFIHSKENNNNNNKNNKNLDMGTALASTQHKDQTL